MRPASYALLHAAGSLFVKMLLMHMYASLFMLLSQANRYADRMRVAVEEAVATARHR